MCSTVRLVLPGVRGCGETIMALRVFSSASPMQHTVDSGLVQGTTLATTPRGLANLRMPFSRSSSTRSQVLASSWSRMVPLVLFWTLWNLSSKTPMPDSSTARRARASAVSGLESSYPTA